MTLGKLKIKYLNFNFELNIVQQIVYNTDYSLQYIQFTVWTVQTIVYSPN